MSGRKAGSTRRLARRVEAETKRRWTAFAGIAVVSTLAWLSFFGIERAAEWWINASEPTSVQVHFDLYLGSDAIWNILQISIAAIFVLVFDASRRRRRRRPGLDEAENRYFMSIARVVGVVSILVGLDALLAPIPDSGFDLLGRIAPPAMAFLIAAVVAGTSLSEEELAIDKAIRRRRRKKERAIAHDALENVDRRQHASSVKSRTVEWIVIIAVMVAGGLFTAVMLPEKGPLALALVWFVSAGMLVILTALFCTVATRFIELRLLGRRRSSFAALGIGIGYWTFLVAGILGNAFGRGDPGAARLELSLIATAVFAVLPAVSTILIALIDRSSPRRGIIMSVVHCRLEVRSAKTKAKTKLLNRYPRMVRPLLT